MNFSPAEVAHAGSHFHLPTIDVCALAHTMHAFDWHGTRQGAWTLHIYVPLRSRGQSRCDESPVHSVSSSTIGASTWGHLLLQGSRHRPHAHPISVCNPTDGAVGWAFEGMLLDDLRLTSSHPSSAGKSATKRSAHGIGHGPSSLPHLAGVAVDYALTVLAAVGGIPLRDHAVSITVINYPGLCCLLPHWMHREGLWVHSILLSCICLVAAHAHVFPVKTATATADYTDTTNNTDSSASSTTSNTSNTHPLELGHIWCSRLAAEAWPLGYTWTLRTKRKVTVTIKCVRKLPICCLCMC